ncbi:MAG TPA: tRNA (adenosine(37)-N6)-dimethylallyltransferase MiaA [Burkholderiaceae bacterium]|nr:tRNA (adenosine(37)-N6)-dimethylallyltransferase MiaA [Burkholderiaceae bacterium]
MGDRVDAVMLLGPTASGKSALAMQLADKVALEIVSVDSAQVYRGLDIGTAKPSTADRAAIAHHLIDIRDPADPYSAADFVRDATVAIGEIRARGKLPLLVGGTMLYAKALRDGLSDLPSADPAMRAQIESEARAIGWPALHARLEQVDPSTAARLKPNDSQRIQRALEIFYSAGAPMSTLLGRDAASLKLSTVALLPADRALLHERIAKRFDAMLQAGLMDEVRSLHGRGDLHPNLPSMRSVGYRQAWRFVDGQCTFEEFRAAGIAATRQLAKRQMTWLRSMPAVTVIEPTSSAAMSAVQRLS